jgi:hypothetical protein
LYLLLCWDCSSGWRKEHMPEIVLWPLIWATPSTKGDMQTTVLVNGSESDTPVHQLEISVSEPLWTLPRTRLFKSLIQYAVVINKTLSSNQSYSTDHHVTSPLQQPLIQIIQRIAYFSMSMHQLKMGLINYILFTFISKVAGLTRCLTRT